MDVQAALVAAKMLMGLLAAAPVITGAILWLVRR